MSIKNLMDETLNNCQTEAKEGQKSMLFIELK